METSVLTDGERAFLELISRAVFSNPFSDERVRADEAIIGSPAPLRAEDRVDAAVERTRDFLVRFQAAHGQKIQTFGGRDRELVETAYLFEVYHRFLDCFDDLIRRQIEAGDASCQVPFAGEALEVLASRGFVRAEACRYFALFYQLRRAYHFIARALIGRSPCMKQLRLSLWNNVFTRDVRLYERHLWNRMEDFSTLLLGETGTGKGAAAAAIGRSGFIPFDDRRRCFAESFTRSFIAVNLAQFPEPLLESELFGHRKGAFTGAVEAHEGVLARCSPYGAIFLDEIGDVAVPVQIKLLKVLQDREFSPVGSHDRRRFRGRVIAASNRSIDRLRNSALFRDDFFYRLCSDVITVPTLRQRLAEDPAELPDLVALTVRRIVGEDSAPLTELVCQALRRDIEDGYGWPGNVRELEQAVRRILLTRQYGGDRRSPPAGLHEEIARGIAAGSLTADDLLSAYCRLLHERHGTYEDVARRTNLDRRTVKRYLLKKHD